MKRHSVAQFGGGWRTPAVKAKEVRHGAKCLVRIPGPEPAERVQSAAAKVEVHDRSTSEIDHQSGCLAFESNGPAAIRHNLGRCHDQRHDERSEARHGELTTR